MIWVHRGDFAVQKAPASLKLCIEFIFWIEEKRIAVKNWSLCQALWQAQTPIYCRHWLQILQAQCGCCVPAVFAKLLCKFHHDLSLCCSRANSKNKQCITDLSTIMKICPSLYSVCSIHALRLNLDVSFGSSCVLHGSLPFFTLHAAYYFYWCHTFLAWTCTQKLLLISFWYPIFYTFYDATAESLLLYPLASLSAADDQFFIYDLRPRS